MKLLEDVLKVAEEIKRLQQMERDLHEAKEKIAQIERAKKEEEEVFDLLLPIACPEEYRLLVEKMKKQAKKDPWDGGREAKEFLQRPRALGCVKICTHLDRSADSGGNWSEYGLFLLVSDGRVLPVVNLGMYGGAFRDKPPTLKEILARRLPCFDLRSERSAVIEKAPQCLKAIEAIEDSD